MNSRKVIAQSMFQPHRGPNPKGIVPQSPRLARAYLGLWRNIRLNRNAVVAIGLPQRAIPAATALRLRERLHRDPR